MTKDLRDLDSILVSSNHLVDYLSLLPENLSRTNYHNPSSVGDAIKTIEELQEESKDPAIIIIDKNISSNVDKWRENYSKAQYIVHHYLEGYNLAFRLNKNPDDNLAVPSLALFIRDSLNYKGPLGVICEKRSFTENLFNLVLSSKKITTFAPGDPKFDLIVSWAVDQIVDYKTKIIKNHLFFYFQPKTFLT